MKTSDITDLLVVEYAEKCMEWLHRDMRNCKNIIEMLMEATGYPEKVVYRACERANKRNLIDYGTSIRYPWATEEGIELLKKNGAMLPRGNVWSVLEP